MTQPHKSPNPFQTSLVPVGVVFALSACAYGVMALHRIDATRNPGRGSDSQWLLEQLDRHGATLLLIELTVLAVTFLAAVATDAYWKRRASNRRVLGEGDSGPAGHDE